MQRLFFFTCLSGISLKNGWLSSYILFIYLFFVDATHRPLNFLRLLNFNHCATDMNVSTNYDSHYIVMVDYWLASVPTEKSIRRGGVRFKYILYMAHNIFP